MDESTTTPEPTDTGVQETQPADVDTQTAENQPAEPAQTTDSQEAESNPVADENLAWLQANKGIDPNTPEGVAKLAEMYRNAEKQMHESTQKKAELQSALEQAPDEVVSQYQDDPVAALTAQVQALQMKGTVTDFFTSNPDAKQYEAQMTDMVTTNPNLKALVNSGYLNIENLYQMAKGADSSREQSIKSEGGREALQKVVDRQQAKAVAPAASSSAMSTQGPTKATVNDWYASLTPEQRQSPETQNTLASLLT